MKNREIYGKTLPFSLLRLLYSFLALIVAIALPVVGFLLTQSNDRLSVIVTGICAIIGVVLYGLVARYLGYLLKAGQIAMITGAEALRRDERILRDQQRHPRDHQPADARHQRGDFGAGQAQRR